MNQKSKKNKSPFAPDNFSYAPNDIEGLYGYVQGEKKIIRENHEFIGGYNTNQITEMLFKATSKQISDFRNILFSVYRYAGKGTFLETDVAAMKEMLKLIEIKLDSKDYDLDKIQLMQIDCLYKNLRQFISQME